MRNLLRTALIVALLISVATNVFMYQRYRNRRVVMTINNHPVLQQDVYDRLIQSGGETVKVQLTQRHLIDDEAEKQKLVPTEAEIQEKFNQQRETNWQFARNMTQNPWLELEAKNEIRQNLELERLLTAKVPVTEDQIKEEYITLPANYDTPNKAYCYLALIRKDSDNMDNIKQLMDKRVSTASIEQNYPKDVIFLGDNTVTAKDENGKDKIETGLFIIRQAFGSQQGKALFDLKPGDVKVVPPGEFANQGFKAAIIRMVKIVPGQKADLNDPKTHEKIRLEVAKKRAGNPKDYLLGLWKAADFRSEDPNDKKYIGKMLGEKAD